MDLDQTDRIRLSVPAATSAVRVVRAGAAGLATRAGFTYQEVEQLQLAVAEAAALLAPDADGQGTLVVTFDVEPSGLVVELTLAGADETRTTRPAAATARTEAPAPVAGAVADLATAVLDAAVDEWHVDADGRRIVLRKDLQDVDLDE